MGPAGYGFDIAAGIVRRVDYIVFLPGSAGTLPSYGTRFDQWGYLAFRSLAGPEQIGRG